MFAPYCPTCRSRILLGLGRIVAGIDADGTLDSPILACWCGTHVAWNAGPPAEPDDTDERRAWSELSPA